MYAQTAVKPYILHRNGASPIVMRGVQKCTGAGASLRDRNVQPLCCINLDTATDPPYNTGEAFEEYNDNLEHSIWLELMYQRLQLLKNLLAEDGVIFVQLNDDEMNYCKVMMDEIFGRSNFINLVSVKTKNSSGASGGGEDRKLKKNIEFIICYGKPQFRKFYPSYTTVELSKYLEDMRTNGVSFKYTTVFTDLGERKYYKTIKDGSGNDIIIYSHSGYKTKSIRQLAQEDGLTEIETFKKYYEYICTTENAQTSIRTRVRETTDEEDKIYMVETKASNEMDRESVKEKAAAAVVYCNAVSGWNADNGGKPWEYVLVSHDEVRINSSFKYLVSNRASYRQIGLEDCGL